MLESFGSLLALLVMALAAYGLGRPVVRRLRCDNADPLAGTVWSLGLGMTLAGIALMVLGLVGLLYRPLIGVLTFAAAFWALYEVRLAWQTRGAGAGDCFGRHPPVWLTHGLGALAALAALGSLIAALAPATDGDALCYHLELPKLFLNDHALAFVAFNDNATFPLLAEMWYLWALCLDGPIAAQLVHWGLGLLLAAAAVLVAEVVLGRPWAWLAGALMLLVPGISNQMTAALNDLALATFTTLAVAAWMRGRGEEHAQPAMMLAGIFLGAALSIKYTAALFMAAWGACWLYLLLRQAGRRREHLQSMAVVFVLAAAVAGPWYVRAAWHRGNPVYPFFNRHLGQAGPDALHKRKTPLGWDAASVASLPWTLTMHAERFGGRANQLGPMFLLVLPGLLVVRRLQGLGPLLAIAAVYTLLWYVMRQNVRFLYPIAPLLAVAVVWFWMELRRLPGAPRLVAACVFAGVALVGTLAALNRARPHLSVALGWQDHEAYLMEHEPSYTVALVANRLLGKGDRILSQDHRTFYFDVPVTRENIFHRITRYDQHLERPAQLADVLKQEGFTHLVLAESTGLGVRYNDRLSDLVAAARAADPASWQDLLDYKFLDVDGALRRYRLVELR